MRADVPLREWRNNKRHDKAKPKGGTFGINEVEKKASEK